MRVHIERSNREDMLMDTPLTSQHSHQWDAFTPLGVGLMRSGQLIAVAADGPVTGGSCVSRREHALLVPPTPCPLTRPLPLPREPLPWHSRQEPRTLHHTTPRPNGGQTYELIIIHPHHPFIASSWQQEPTATNCGLTANGALRWCGAGARSSAGPHSWTPRASA